MGLVCDLCLFFRTLGDWGAGAGQPPQDWLGAALSAAMVSSWPQQLWWEVCIWCWLLA